MDGASRSRVGECPHRTLCSEHQARSRPAPRSCACECRPPAPGRCTVCCKKCPRTSEKSKAALSLTAVRPYAVPLQANVAGGRAHTRRPRQRRLCCGHRARCNRVVRPSPESGGQPSLRQHTGMSHSVSMLGRRAGQPPAEEAVPAPPVRRGMKGNPWRGDGTGQEATWGDEPSFGGFAHFVLCFKGAVSVTVDKAHSAAPHGVGMYTEYRRSRSGRGRREIWQECWPLPRREGEAHQT